MNALVRELEIDEIAEVSGAGCITTHSTNSAESVTVCDSSGGGGYGHVGYAPLAGGGTPYMPVSGGGGFYVMDPAGNLQIGSEVQNAVSSNWNINPIDVAFDLGVIIVGSTGGFSISSLGSMTIETLQGLYDGVFDQ